MSKSERSPFFSLGADLKQIFLCLRLFFIIFIWYQSFAFFFSFFSIPSIICTCTHRHTQRERDRQRHWQRALFIAAHSVHPHSLASQAKSFVLSLPILLFHSLLFYIWRFHPWFLRLNTTLVEKKRKEKTNIFINMKRRGGNVTTDGGRGGETSPHNLRPSHDRVRQKHSSARSPCRLPYNSWASSSSYTQEEEEEEQQSVAQSSHVRLSGAQNESQKKKEKLRVSPAQW